MRPKEISRLGFIKFVDFADFPSMIYSEALRHLFGASTKKELLPEITTGICPALSRTNSRTSWRALNRTSLIRRPWPIEPIGTNSSKPSSSRTTFLNRQAAIN
jgi:hypothetical protein